VATRRALRPGRRAPRRGTNWTRFTLPVFTAVPAASKVFIAPLVPSNPGLTETIIRTRGVLSIQSDQGAAREDQIGAFGCVVVSDIAATAGAASIPGPFTEALDDGWWVWEGFANTGLQVDAQGGPLQVHFDSKAARRVPEGFQGAVMIENAHATFALEFALSMSVLAVQNT